MKRIAFLLTAFALAVGLTWSFEQKQHAKNEAAVRAAVLDYVEGIYEVEPERIKRSVHTSLRKHGFWKDPEGNYREFPMNFDQLVELAGRWNKDGSRANADSPKKITIFEVKDMTASAKVVAEWGQDYFHLANYEGKWMITNVIWQSIPDEEKR